MGYDVEGKHGDRRGLAARRQRAAIAVVQVLGLTVWFSVSAVVPSLRQDWGISTVGAVWLTGATQVGFVIGAVGSATLNLADRVAAHTLLAVSAASAAVCTVVLALFVDGMGAALPLRFLTGVFLAGVYPVGMKLMASWAPSAGRGLALGVLIGALTLGSILPQLISGLGALPWPTVLLVASALGGLGALVAILVVRPGPYLACGTGTPHSRYSLAMFTQRGPLLANLGYFGHMWELYALWTWLPTFLLASPAARELPGSVGLVVFATMGIVGVAGCLLGGWGADRFGRAPAAVAALVVSGACCLLSPLAFRAGPALLVVFCAVWGASVVADSGVFSTSLSETVDPRHIGTALTAQTAVGFALTAVSIQLVPLLADAVGWQYAFLLLVPGPVIGVRAMQLLGARATRQHHNTTPIERGVVMATTSTWPLGQPAVGSTAELSRAVCGNDIDLFTMISGDRNPLHDDTQAAESSRFGQIVVQGGVTTAILNAVVAEELPGPGTVFLSVAWSFTAPVRPGDLITGRVVVTEVRDDKPITKLTCSVTRADGTVAVDGTAVCWTMPMPGRRGVAHA